MKLGLCQKIHKLIGGGHEPEATSGTHHRKIDKLFFRLIQEVHADRKVEVQADDHLTVAVNQHIKIGTGQFVEAGQEIHPSSGLNVALEAGSELTIKASGNFIKIDSSGVTVSGPVVNVNSGGSPGNGTGATPFLPRH